MHTVDYDRGVIRCWWLFAVIHWFKEADQPGWVGEGWGARGVIVRILAITQATHPCLITSCLATYSQFFLQFLDNVGMFAEVFVSILATSKTTHTPFSDHILRGLTAVGIALLWTMYFIFVILSPQTNFSMDAVLCACDKYDI